MAYFCSAFINKWDVSSVGLERLLDRQEVTGSIPVRPTLKIKGLQAYRFVAFFVGYIQKYIQVAISAQKNLLKTN